ncbi:MAG TPA: carboxypeptidase regulatory-like domain-containing protein [Candidatus Eremiobacteraceae bacterium]|nr:carboxypeptidase regulatory-like domain-containing protein [Candidatus Eremiobacteraceae bacterium]
MPRICLCLSVLLCLSSFASAQKKSSTTQPGTPDEAAPAPPAEARASVSDGSEKLPVRRVVLYKNGVGYFEHLGRVSGSQDVHIDFTSEQLNDVLKSLTVLDLSGGRITAVDYNSEAPLARRLATLRLALGERPSQSEFLAALRGARIEVRSGTAGPIIGKLLSVERKTRSSTTLTIETDEISLITDSGEVRSVDLNPSTSVRILEHDLQVEVNRYLGLVAAAREQDVRRMSISTTGSGERNLYVSYISEVPIWKTTYRIVLPTRPDKKPLLQGWAVVDNTVGEDWNDVELSLVAGAPHSFIQQLSEPYYGRRPVVALPQNVQLAPQTHAATLLGGNGRLAGQVTDPSGAVVSGTSVMLLDESGNPVANTFTDSAGNYSFSGLPIGNYRLELDKTGFRRILVSQLNVSPGENQMNANLQIGSTAETVEVTSSAAGSASTQSSEMASNAIALPGVANRPRIASGSGAGVGPGEGGGVGGGSFRAGASGVPANSYLEAARELSGSAANGQDLGDLFDYKLKDRVTLKKNQSALVPIVQTDIVAEKVSLWNGTARSGRPLRALWLTNTSPLTLDGGSFSVLENEVFAGEGLTDPIKPGERRLLSYATDLALLVEARKSGDPQHVTRVKIAKGVMTQTSEIRERTVYTVRNQDDSACVLVIEQPARPDASLAKRSKEPEERAPGVYRFKIEVPAKASASLPVEEVRVLQSNFRLADLDDSQIAVFSKNGTITPDMAQALQKIAAQKAVLSKLEQDMEDRQKDIDRIVADQARLRENMKALRGSAEEKALLQRYTGELDQQETQLTSLRKTIQDTEAQRDKANDQLQDMIENVQLESTM